MMNFGLRCSQILAERSDIKKMNIIERTALWYRLERIGGERDEEGQTPFRETYVEPEHITRIYTHLSIDKKALELQQRIVSLEEKEKLKAYAKAEPKYKY